MRNTLPSSMGKVSVAIGEQYPYPASQSNAFVNAHEVLRDEVQMPQFLPRVPGPVIAGSHAGYNNAQINQYISVMDWESQPHRHHLRGLIGAHHLPVLSNPMPPFTDTADRPILYQGYDWFEHFAVCQRILRKTAHTFLEDREMSALLTIMTYGLDPSTVLLRPWKVAFDAADRGATNPLSAHVEHFDRECYISQLNLGRDRNPLAGLGEMGSGDLWKRMYGRRWIVAPIRFARALWVMTIFDRRAQQLYIFDCGTKVRRELRIKVVTHLWVKFWNHMHRPFTFQYIVPETTQQPRNGTSGTLAVMWAMLNLRNRVGRFMRTNDESIKHQDIHFCGDDTTYELLDSSLPLHDWIPDGCRDGNAGLTAVDRIIRCMLQNELGLDLTPFNQTFRNQPTLQSARDRVTHLNLNFIAGRDEVPSLDFWTGQGGVQYALPQGVGVLPYDPNAERFHYRATPAPDREPVIADPALLVNHAHPPMRWRRALQFNAGYTMRDPMPPRVVKLRNRRHQHGLPFRHYRAFLLQKELGGPFNHWPLLVDLTNIRTHREARRSQRQALKFELGLSYPGQARVEQTVIIPWRARYDRDASPDDPDSDDSRPDKDRWSNESDDTFSIGPTTEGNDADNEVESTNEDSQSESRQGGSPEEERGNDDEDHTDDEEQPGDEGNNVNENIDGENKNEDADESYDADESSPYSTASLSGAHHSPRGRSAGNGASGSGHRSESAAPHQAEFNKRSRQDKFDESDEDEGCPNKRRRPGSATLFQWPTSSRRGKFS